MIINLSVKDNKKALFINEPISNVKTSKSGKSYSFMISEASEVILTKDGKEIKITGKELIEKLF